MPRKTKLKIDYRDAFMDMEDVIVELTSIGRLLMSCEQEDMVFLGALAAQKISELRRQYYGAAGG